MPNWQTIIVFCFAFAAAVYFKFILPDPDRDDGGPDEVDLRMARLKRFRMEHGTCIYCGEQLPNGRVASTLTSSVCPHCGPDFVG